MRARAGYEALHPPPVRASVEFTATDQAREYIDLAREDMEVIEDGAIQQIDVFHEVVAPVAIVLAVDASGSMTSAAGIARQAAAHFVDAVPAATGLPSSSSPTRPSSLPIFSSGARGARGDRPLHTTGRYRAVRRPSAFDAAAEDRRRSPGCGRRHRRPRRERGLDGCRQRGHVGYGGRARKVDGRDHLRDRSGIRVERARLQQLADLTGGEAYFTGELASLDGEYRRVVQDLHRRYVLGYTSTNGTRDGAWRTVELRSHGEALRLRSRGGYYAPEQ